jgi:GGDEF domain-containing protein
MKNDPPSTRRRSAAGRFRGRPGAEARGPASRAAARKAGRGGDPLAELARVLRGTHAPSEALAAVAHQAHRLSGAARVTLELADEAGVGPARPPVSWPPAEGAPPAEAPPGALALPLVFHGRRRGTLTLTPARPVRAWPEALVRRLEILATLAAAALVRPSPDQPSGGDPVRDEQTGAHSGAFLAAYLSQAVAQARRRGEPLSVICVGLDRLDCPEEAAPGRVEGAMRRAVRTMLAALRAGDMVARLDRFQLAAALPGASQADARSLAESLLGAIETAVAAPSPVASLGVATFPDDAGEPGPLLAAAREALARAYASGPGEIVTAPARSRGRSSLRLRVG